MNGRLGKKHASYVGRVITVQPWTASPPLDAGPLRVDDQRIHTGHYPSVTDNARRSAASRAARALVCGQWPARTSRYLIRDQARPDSFVGPEDPITRC